MLSFQIKENEVQICCDQKGMETIISALNRVKKDGDHIHLRSPSSGGNDLDEKSPWDEPAVSVVTITWCED